MDFQHTDKALKMSHRRSPLHCAMDWMFRLTILSGVTLVGIFVYSLGWEKPFLSYEGVPFEVTKPAVIGEVVPMVVYRCSRAKTPKTYVNTRKLLNLDTGEGYVLGNTVSEVSPGCERLVSLVNHIPKEARPGMYVLVGTAEVPGMIRDHSVPWQSVRFQVVAPNE